MISLEYCNGYSSIPNCLQVAPAELEALLRSHPDIQEAGVIGIPDERSGEVPKAFVVAKSGKNPTESDIKNFLKGKVTSYKELQGNRIFVILRLPSSRGSRRIRFLRSCFKDPHEILITRRKEKAVRISRKRHGGTVMK